MKLKLIVVDDEFMILENTLLDLEQCPSVESAVGFAKPSEALEWFSSHDADAAVLDIQMDGMSGLELARKLREISPELPVIFLTGYMQYATDAFRVHADAYLQKPITPELVESELQKLALKGVFRFVQNVRLRVRCFGNFDVFSPDGAPLHFTMAKCKELLAFLINQKGASVSMAELAAVLWENRPGDAKTMALLRRTIADLRKDLESIGAENVLIKSRNCISVAPALIDCDYYSWEDSPADVFFPGEYMSQYSWGEYTTGILCRKAGII